MKLENIIAERKNKKIYRDGDRCIKVFNEDFSKADVLNEGKDITIIASGTMVYEGQLAVEELKQHGINAELISANFIKPLDKETILKSIKKTNKVITCENHNVIDNDRYLSTLIFCFFSFL